MAHAGQSLGHASPTLGRVRVGRARVLLGSRASLPLSADGWPSLFEGFRGTITWSDSAETYTEAVRPRAFASRSGRFGRSDISAVSRFSCRKFLDVPGVFDDAGSAADSRYRPPPYGLPLKSSRVGTPMAAFRSPIAQPIDAPIHASAVASRRPPQDLGSGWLARLFLWDSCIPDFLPVYPGATDFIQLGGVAQRLCETFEECTRNFHHLSLCI
jgi:hypothetical protein